MSPAGLQVGALAMCVVMGPPVVEDSAATLEKQKKVCWEKGADVSVPPVRKDVCTVPRR